MSKSKVVVNLRVREKAPREGLLAYQAEVEPRAVYEGRELHRRLSEFLGLPSDGYRARTMIENIEAFVRRELEQGHRLDFGLVSFFPKLSAALPTRDADPGEVDVFVRGAVKARKTLSASLEDHLVARNPMAGDPIWIGNVLNEALDDYDLVTKGDVLSVVCAHLTVDPECPDGGRLDREADQAPRIGTYSACACGNRRGEVHADPLPVCGPAAARVLQPRHRHTRREGAVLQAPLCPASCPGARVEDAAPQARRFCYTYPVFKSLMKTTASDTALLSNDGRMIFFSFGGKRIRFLGAKCLRRFTDIRKWHDGYIEVMADNGGTIEEEYIDLVPILENLCINPADYVKPIKKVELTYG